jgi:uncharacterized protein YpbB
LHSLIPPTALHNDQRISEFGAAHHTLGDLQNALAGEKALYANRLLLRLFTFTELSALLDEWQDLIAKKDFPDKDAATALRAQICTHLGDLNTTAGKFQLELQRLIAAMESDRSRIGVLKERCGKAIRYFTDQIADKLIAPLRAHRNGLAYMKKMKRYLQLVQIIEESFWRKIDVLYHGRFLDEALYSGEILHTKDKLPQVFSSATRGKKEKGGTFMDTLDLHRQGKTVDEIAAIRSLTPGTIKHHLSQWITRGEIDVHAVLPADMIDSVTAFVQETKIVAVGAIRSGLGEKYDYNDIRMIVSHILRTQAPERAASVPDMPLATTGR